MGEEGRGLCATRQPFCSPLDLELPPPLDLPLPPPLDSDNGLGDEFDGLPPPPPGFENEEPSWAPASYLEKGS